MDRQKQRKIAIRVTIKKNPLIQKQLPILEDDKKFTIGSSFSDNNSFYLPVNVGLIHFELDFSKILIPKNISEFSNEYSEVLKSCSVKQDIIDKIGQFVIDNKQKIQIKDISGRGGYPSLINITNQCENQSLNKGNVFIIGLRSEIKIQQNNQHFKDFLESPELFEISSKTIFLGLCSGLDNLCKGSFQGQITKNEFYKNLKSQESDQVYQEFVSKNCLYIRVEDELCKQNYLLVQNSTKNSFTIGRSESCDIQFKSQAVSYNHGMIKYIERKQEWIIVDGYKKDDGKDDKDEKDDNLCRSSNGTWLQMKPKQNYYIDNEQIIKVQDVEINFILM